MLLVPLKLETTFTRFPVANWVIIAANVILFFLPVFNVVTYEDLEPLVLREWDAGQILGSLFLHGDIFHLLGNMLFLWVFGNAINASVGNVSYPFLYLSLGVCASVVHLSFDAHAAIGASGAINGVVGMVLILFPYNRIHNFYWFALPGFLAVRTGRFETKALWMILYWNIFDFIAVFIGSEDGIGHWAHIGGLVFGLILASFAAKLKLVDTYSPSVFDVISGNASDPRSFLASPLDDGVSLLVRAESIAPALLPTPEVESPGQTVLPKPAPKRAPEIGLRVCVGNESSVVCHIVNNGGPISDISLRVPKGVSTQLSPPKFWYGGQTGWMRFTADNGDTIDSIEFILAYKDGTGASGRKRFRCVPAEKSLVEIEALPKPAGITS